MKRECNEIPKNLLPPFFDVKSYKTSEKILHDQKQYVQFSRACDVFCKMQNRHSLFVYRQGSLHLAACLEWLYRSRLIFKPFKSIQAATTYIHDTIYQQIVDDPEIISILEKLYQNKHNPQSENNQKNLIEQLSNNMKCMQTLQFIVYSYFDDSYFKSMIKSGIQLTLVQGDKKYKIQSVKSNKDSMQKKTQLKLLIKHPSLKNFFYQKGSQSLEVIGLKKQMNSPDCRNIYNDFDHSLERQLRLHAFLSHEFQVTQMNPHADICNQAGFINLCWIVQAINTQLASQDWLSIIDFFMISDNQSLSHLDCLQAFDFTDRQSVLLNIGLHVLKDPKDLAYLRYPIHSMFRGILYMYYNSASFQYEPKQVVSQNKEFNFSTYCYAARIPSSLLDTMKRDGMFVNNSGFICAYPNTGKLPACRIDAFNCAVYIKIPSCAYVQQMKHLLSKHGIQIVNQCYLGSLGYCQCQDRNGQQKMLINPWNLFKVVQVSSISDNNEGLIYKVVLQLQEMMKIKQSEKVPDFTQETQQNKIIINNVLAYQGYLNSTTQILKQVKTQQDAIYLLNTQQQCSQSVPKPKTNIASLSHQHALIQSATFLINLTQQISSLLQQTSQTKPQHSDCNTQRFQISQMNFKLIKPVMKILSMSIQKVGPLQYRLLVQRFVCKYLEFRFSLATYLIQGNISVVEVIKQWSQVNRSIVSDQQFGVGMVSNLCSSYISLHNCFIRNISLNMQLCDDFYAYFVATAIVMENYLAEKCMSSILSDKLINCGYMQLLLIVGKILKRKVCMQYPHRQISEESLNLRPQFVGQLSNMNVSQAGQDCLLAAFPHGL